MRQGVIGRLVRIGRCWGTNLKEERTKVMGISRQPSKDTLWQIKHNGAECAIFQLFW
jgi:hypothetical protein